MNKAEEFALKALPKEIFKDEISEKIRIGMAAGYQQAEQDLALTWEDMMLIHKCIKDAMNYKLYKMMEGIEGQKEVYEEVLKRFKDFKERKQK